MGQAGGLSREIIETPMPVEAVAAPVTSSISPTFIVIGVLAALLIAAAAAEDDEDTPPPPARSDIRLKTDITQIGKADNGLAIYSFRYTSHDALFSGVMAHNFLTHTPESVITMPDGY